MIPPTIFIDMQSPRDHKRLNSFYLHYLFEPKSCLYVADEMHPHYTAFTTASLGRLHTTNRVKLAKRVMRIIANHPNAKIVFLSYELASFPLLALIARYYGATLFCFEHNTAPRNRIRVLFHRASRNIAKRFVYTPYLQTHYAKARIPTQHIDHPCLPSPPPIDATEWDTLIRTAPLAPSRIGFCPSGSIALSQIEAWAIDAPDTLFVVKNTRTSKCPNIITHPYFENYDAALHQCDFLALPFASDYHVSGPAYEAIANGTPIMTLDNAFGRYLRHRFPDRVVFAGEPLPPKKSDSDLTPYNQAIIDKLKQAIYGS